MLDSNTSVNSESTAITNILQTNFDMLARSSSDELFSFMDSLGFTQRPEHGIIYDGQIRRFSRDAERARLKDISCWYFAHHNLRRDGTNFDVVVFADFRDGKDSKPHYFHSQKLKPREKTIVNKQIQVAVESAKRHKEEREEFTAKEAERILQEANDTEPTAYMIRKKINQFYGCKAKGSMLLVPLRDVHGKIWTLQRIFAEQEKTKLFLPEGRKKGNFHVIGEDISTCKEAYVVEGFATGVSVFEATGKTVIVAIDKGNLIEVIKNIKEAFPQISITIAGDDDRDKKENAGRDAATKAAMLCDVSLVFPSLKENDVGISDFNDIHIKYGLKTVTQMLEIKVEKPFGFRPLGYLGSHYYFYELRSKDIVKMNSFKAENLFQLCPQAYWIENFPSKEGISLNNAANSLIDEARKIGPYNTDRVRGLGVWKDDAVGYVFNSGHKLYVNGKQVSYSSIESWSIYVRTMQRISDLSDTVLTKEEGRRISDICQSLSWVNNEDGVLLAGWLMISFVSGALPIRPHIWITGESGTGKSTIADYILKKILPDSQAQSTTTEAGLRQNYNNMSMPLIFDEIESDTSGGQMRIKNIIELFRSTHSQGSGPILKGGSDGKGMKYNVNMAGALLSIRPQLIEAADKSRFCLLELKAHDKEKKKEFFKNVSFIDQEISGKLCARAFAKIPVILENFKIISQEVAAHSTQRQGDQVGMILAGFWLLENDEPITQEKAKILVDNFYLSKKEEQNDIQADHWLCLNHLLTTKVTLAKDLGEKSQKKTEILIGDAIFDVFWNSELKLYGLIVEDNFLYVSNTHTELGKIYRHTKWNDKWNQSLKRIENAESTSSKSFGGRLHKSKSVKIPLESISPKSKEEPT